MKLSEIQSLLKEALPQIQALGLSLYEAKELVEKGSLTLTLFSPSEEAPTLPLENLLKKLAQEPCLKVSQTRKTDPHSKVYLCTKILITLY